jgi:two-component system sensor histidine kinase/response regulator
VKSKKLVSAMEHNTDAPSKEAVRLLQEQYQMLELVSEMVHLGYWQLDIKGKQISWSEQTSRIHGMDPKDPPPDLDEAIRFYHPDDMDAVIKIVDAAVEAQQGFHFIKRLIGRDGVERMIESHGRPEFDDAGEVIGLLGTIQDVTERESAARTDREKNKKLSALNAFQEVVFANVPNCLYIKDQRARIVQVNEAFFQLYPEELRAGMIEHSTYDDFIGESEETIAEQDTEAFSEGYSEVEQHVACPDGKVRSLLIKKTRFEDDLGQAFILCLAQDMTEQNRATQQLTEYAEKLEWKQLQLEAAINKSDEATRMKSEFLANMSHEIRTPLNGVIGMNNLLLKTDLNAQQKYYVDIVDHSAEHLLSLLNDILDYSKVEAGKLELEIIPVDLLTLMDETIKLMAVKAREKDLEVIMRYATDAPRYVFGDPSRIRQLLANYISNAIKFTDEGHVLINLSAIPVDISKGVYSFLVNVEDTGVGVPKDAQRSIFNQFTQEDNSTSRKYGGTGLGLAICKELASLMDGGVGLESDPGIGSSFWFTMQLQEDEHGSEAEDAATLPDFEGKKVAVVEPHPLVQQVLSEQLQECGATVLEYDKIEQMQEETGSVCILDATALPKNLDQLPGCLKELPCFLLVEEFGQGHRLKEDLNAHLGNVHLILKPLNVLEAMQEVHATTQNPVIQDEKPLPESHDEPDPDESKMFEGMRLLLVEDNPVNQIVAKTMLEKLHCHVDIAQNGKEAVEHYKNGCYAMIFMDCHMPEMDGYEASRAIRDLEKQNNSSTPIIALTANAMKGDEKKCLDAGMNGYLPKPVRMEALQVLLSKHLSQSLS